MLVVLWWRLLACGWLPLVAASFVVAGNRSRWKRVFVVAGLLPRAAVVIIRFAASQRCFAVLFFVVVGSENG